MLNKILSLLIVIIFFWLLYFFYTKNDNKKEFTEIIKKEETTKIPYLEKVKKTDIQTNNEETITNSEKKEKIEALKTKVFLEKTFTFFKISDDFYIFLNDLENWILSINLLKNNKEFFLTKIKKIPKNNIKIDKVYQNNDMIYLSFWDEKYFFNTKSMLLERIFFPQNINYIKDAWNWIYIIINEKWSFLMNKKTNKIEFFYLFSDFVYTKDWNYIWVINKNEIEKKRNYNLTSNKNLIIKYYPNTKKMNILEEVDFEIKKIISKNDFEIYFYDEKDNEYILKNF